MQPQYIPKGPSVQRICILCGKFFMAHAHTIANGGGKFCSQVCHLDYQKAQARLTLEQAKPVLCACGCGRPTTIALYTHRSRGEVRGQPNQYLHGHQRRGHHKTLAERFWPRVKKLDGPDACWLWTGTMFPNGYGRMWVSEEQTLLAHRVSYELAYGPIPEGQLVMHQCDVKYPVQDTSYRRCVNPAHLTLGTHTENVRHAVDSGRFSMRPPNRNTTIPDAIVIQMRERAATSGLSMAAIGREFGVSPAYAWRLITRLNRTNIP